MNANLQNSLGPGVIEKLTHFIHSRFLLLLISSYVLAGMLPQFGSWLRHVSFGAANFPGTSPINISLPLVMLSLLLFNAGIGVKASEMSGLWRRPQILISGFLANLVVPILLALVLRQLMGLWHNSDELQNLLVGLALVIAMPIAGSSSAWSQNANGNLSLSLGLVFMSTMLSPFTTPLVLHTFGSITEADYSEDLHELAAQGANTFLLLTVVLPSLLGMVAHFVLGEQKTAMLKPHLKLVNFILLLVLNYSNASNSLPDVFRNPDVDFLGFVLGTTLAFCAAAFFVGWLLARAFKTDKSDQAALMFGLGMNNNGTGLVLASIALADHPAVMLPMIFYTLVQQVLAAVIDSKMFKSPD